MSFQDFKEVLQKHKKKLIILSAGYLTTMWINNIRNFYLNKQKRIKSSNDIELKPYLLCSEEEIRNAYINNIEYSIEIRINHNMINNCDETLVECEAIISFDLSKDCLNSQYISLDFRGEILNLVINKSKGNYYYSNGKIHINTKFLKNSGNQIEINYRVNIVKNQLSEWFIIGGESVEIDRLIPHFHQRISKKDNIKISIISTNQFDCVGNNFLDKKVEIRENTKATHFNSMSLSNISDLCIIGIKAETYCNIASSDHIKIITSNKLNMKDYFDDLSSYLSNCIKYINDNYSKSDKHINIIFIDKEGKGNNQGYFTEDSNIQIISSQGVIIIDSIMLYEKKNLLNELTFLKLLVKLT